MGEKEKKKKDRRRLDLSDGFGCLDTSEEWGAVNVADALSDKSFPELRRLVDR